MANLPTSFRAEHLGFAYGLTDASFELPAAGLITIVGPNGAGKSTLVGIMAGLRRGYKGSCSLDGHEIRTWNRAKLARRVTFLPQTVAIEFPFTVEQVVFMGRTPYSGGWFEAPEDREAVERAMKITDIGAYRDRDFRSLSGGERQRTILASALAQEPKILLLDEPATFLDLKHELAMREVLAALARQGMLVIAVTHDLNFALRYSHWVMLMNRGSIAAIGAPEEVLTPDAVHGVFDVRTRMEGGYLRHGE